ncbi:Fur-regulated basic protein FbpA [Bacillus sp. ISL-34]|uniref:Fur-regulated basic protein FbpA n=1 Tax=Bacillus sp. ISL-34 TaxID=2819121 RepID=UPI001BE78057|nr:Fur-regulated basic protein FbpA [Bacillus sp. ISL-34]MBT2650172.1 Fur-regulated basic protein FbpA [Bacillus sp. ISL-34]
MRKGVEERRKELIYKLMIHTVDKSVEQLMKLTLKELEIEYKKVQNDCHPHSDAGSIQWINAKRH